MDCRMLWAGSIIIALAACGDDDDNGSVSDTADTSDTAAEVTDTAEPDSVEPEVDDTVEPEVGDTNVPDDTDAPDTDAPVEYTKPDYFPDDADADEVLAFANLSGPVRVVYDDRGIPHIYGDSREDIAFVQGFVTARDRIFQMHTLRSAAKGRLAEFGGPGSLSGDIFLRTLRLGSVAEEMAAAAVQNDPMVTEALDAFSAGVNAYLQRLNDDLEATQAPEITAFGRSILYPWSATDTMAIARLQTWDLGFGGVVNELDLWEVMTSLHERFAGTELEGIELDIARFDPTAEVATIEPEGGANQVGEFDLGTVFDNPFFSGGARRGFAKQVRRGFDRMGPLPSHRAFSAGQDNFGSNNWAISGALTESGRPIVANDTHLALRNPAVFYQAHLSNTLAGGDLNVVGVQFAGAPGITLGHNDHAAWGATVVFSDVTDTYVEKLNPERTQVLFEGEWVDLEERVETFEFFMPDSGLEECIDAAPAYVRENLAWSQSLDGIVCRLEITLLDVPHHGPIIPWSFRTDGDGQDIAMSWQWTGFEPTEDYGAVYRLASVTSYDDFKAALDRFGVGAQNWIYGDTDGDIGWYPSHLVPIREHIAAGDTTYPPFLPMPGDTGETEWDGFMPRDQIPQAHNPAQGYLITANADPIGISFDNDPFNDGPYYYGYSWATGYRQAQITRRIQQLLARSSRKITVADMQAVQADKRSNLGADLAPVMVEAVAAAATSDDSRVAALVTPRVQAAADLLAQWADADYEAHSGVGDDVTPEQARASAATAVFNASLPFLLRNLAEDEGMIGLDRLGRSTIGRFLFRLFTLPETMASYDHDNARHPLWDDISTEDIVESKEEIIARSLGQAVAFLADPEKVGPSNSGGFGTDDMTQWRWGRLHTVTFTHNVAAAFNIPSPDIFPNGFPRGGDTFTVDECNPGFLDTRFTYSGGPAIRNVYELNDAISFNGVIPGGQVENPFLPHYDDEAMLWARNEAPPIAYTVEEVLGARERTVDFITLEP